MRLCQAARSQTAAFEREEKRGEERRREEKRGSEVGDCDCRLVLLKIFTGRRRKAFNPSRLRAAKK